eukprot:gb/GECG01007801.1/.p1 GENE.gb/GECG01007801.1/~~gb/GECG01007801.1/.p1  ORF type:complete len:121 (+),score=16.70 gb/GECG01007801.1/:1-363(+)
MVEKMMRKASLLKEGPEDVVLGDSANVLANKKEPIRLQRNTIKVATKETLTEEINQNQRKQVSVAMDQAASSPSLQTHCLYREVPERLSRYQAEKEVKETIATGNSRHGDCSCFPYRDRW